MTEPQISGDSSKRRRGSTAAVFERHGRKCSARNGGIRCSCAPTWQAQLDLPSPDGRRRKTRSFATRALAEAWRADALREVRLGEMRAESGLTLRQAAADFIEGIATGEIENRSGRRYKPSAVRDYEQGFRLRLVPALGARKLADIRRADLQREISRMRRDGCSPSTIHRTANAARALYRWACALDYVASDPTDGLALPAVTGTRDRIASVTEAALLLAAVPDGDRPLWSTAVYAGLRLGELRALRWRDVDLAAGTLTVERSMDGKTAEIIDTKSEAGQRRVPIPAALSAVLAAHRRTRAVIDPDALVFGRGSRPFAPSAIVQRADRAWKTAGLTRITPHECRHTYASFMIAAGVNLKAISTYMGHASITITLDRYGHLLPGSEAQAASQLDALLAAV